MTAQTGDGALADRLRQLCGAYPDCPAATADRCSICPAATQHGDGTRRIDLVEEDARRGFLPLLVPVEGHAVVCQSCGSLVLDNRNALVAHRKHHELTTPIDPRRVAR